MTHVKFSLRNRTYPTLAFAAIGAALLAGCGGGGGNGSTTIGGTGGNNGGNNGGNSGGGQLANASVIGKVVDTNGNPVVGAIVIPDNGGVSATTLSQGSYRIDGLTGIVHRLTATVTQNGINYTGSTEVSARSQAVASNANIELSPSNQQATIAGNVTDTSNNSIPLSGARVFVGVPNGSGTSSLVAFADFQGRYSLQNVPISTKGGNGALPITASVLGYANASSTVSALHPGETRLVSFQLARSSNPGVGTPSNLSVQAFTQSGIALTASSARRTELGSGTGSVYEALRRLLSPAYARAIANRHIAAQLKHLTVRPHISGSAQYAVETDLSFTNPGSGSLSGFTVYSTAGSTPIVQNTSDAYDFLQDPLANFYGDLTFAGEQFAYIPGQQFNFAVSATNTDQTEGGLSPTVSVIPLDLLTVTQPQVGQALPNPATISWNSVANAAGYYVFVYSQFPSIGTQPYFVYPNLNSGQTPIPAGATNYTLPTFAGLPSGGQDFYVVVVGANSDSSALTFSQITRFHIQ